MEVHTRFRVWERKGGEEKERVRTQKGKRERDTLVT